MMADKFKELPRTKTRIDKNDQIEKINQRSKTIIGDNNALIKIIENRHCLEQLGITDSFYGLTIIFRDEHRWDYKRLQKIARGLTIGNKRLRKIAEDIQLFANISAIIPNMTRN